MGMVFEDFVQAVHVQTTDLLAPQRHMLRCGRIAVQKVDAGGNVLTIGGLVYRSLYYIPLCRAQSIEYRIGAGEFCGQ